MPAHGLFAVIDHLLETAVRPVRSCFGLPLPSLSRRSP